MVSRVGRDIAEEETNGFVAGMPIMMSECGVCPHDDFDVTGYVCVHH